MTLEIDGMNVMAIAEIVAFVASIAAMLVVGLIVYLMVRPPRHVRERRRAEKRGALPREMDAEADEELWRLVDRMESRLEVLERALADQVERPAIGRRDEKQDLAPVEDRETGRKE